MIEPDGIGVVSFTGTPFKQKVNNRLFISGDVDILVTAYDRVDGNVSSRKLGLYRAGYQVLKEDGSAVEGFDPAMMNIEFNRLPPDDSSVFLVYAEGSGVSAYGHRRNSNTSSRTGPRRRSERRVAAHIRARAGQLHHKSDSRRFRRQSGIRQINRSSNNNSEMSRPFQPLDGSVNISLSISHH